MYLFFFKSKSFLEYLERNIYHTHTRMCVCMYYVCTCARARMCVCVCVYTYTHIYILIARKHCWEIMSAFNENFSNIHK